MENHDDVRIQVSIVEDDHGVRDCIQALIENSKGCRCASTFATGEDALATVPKDCPDVALVDIGLPGVNGIEVIRQLKRKCPRLKILMWTVYEDDNKIFAALESGADGYLLKRTPPDEILRSIKEVHEGGGPMTGIIARKLIRHFRSKSGKGTTELESLSNRERDILDHLAKGRLYKEIASALNVSYETVHSHVRNIYDKLHVRSRTEAVTKYLAGE